MLRTFGLAAVCLLACTPFARGGYVLQYMAANTPGTAPLTDSNLANPWGIAYDASGGPFFIANNTSGTAAAYSGTGPANVQHASPALVNIPNAAPVTGVVFNGTTDFHGDPFVMVAEDGSINGWRPALGANAETTVAASTNNVYKGVSLANNGGSNRIYAANFRAGTVDVYDGNFNPITVPGGFHDPNIPAGFAPFNIQKIGNALYVSYALQDQLKHDDVAGPGNGFVNKFDFNGNLLQRVASQGVLNSPWGLTMAPANFGPFGGDLLVGNFGNGLINAFNPTTGQFLGNLTDNANHPIFADGLWGLAFGNGGQAGSPDTLYFTAGPNDEADGLFGSITTPEPSAALLLCLFTPLLLRRGRRYDSRP